MGQSIQGVYRKKTIIIVYSLTLFWLAGVQLSSAQSLLEYFNVEDSDLTTPANIASGLSGTNLELSSGSNTTGNSQATSWTRPLPYAQGSSGWDAEISDEAKYFSFSIQVAGAESFTLSELSFEERATGAGPSALTVTINGTEVYSDTIPDSETRLHEIDLSSNFGSDFIEITEAEVRIKGWDDGSRPTDGGGHWRINGIIVEGDVTIGTTANIPYTQNFAGFIFDDDTEVNMFGAENEWQFLSEGNVLEYKGDWGSGSAAGFRGNANVLGYQHTAATDSLTVRLIVRNESGNTIDELAISYDGRVERSDQGRSPEWTVFVNENEIPELFYSTVDETDKNIRHTISDANIPDGEFIQIEWKSDRGEGSNHSKQIGIGNVAVTLDGQYAVSLTGTEGFRMLSTPVETTYEDFLSPIYTQGATDGANTENGDPNIFTWDNASTGDSRSNWDGITNIDQNITAGTGFLVYVFKDDEYGVEGSFPKTLSVSGAENSEVTVNANPNENGWALLGNPFASSISFDDLDSNSLTDAIYIWDVNDGTTEIVDDTKQETISGNWKSYTVGSGSGDIPDGIIAPFQGFFVESGSGNSPSVGFVESAKTTGGNFMGKETSRSLVRLELNGEGMSNSVWLSFSENGSMGQVYGDAHQLQPLSSNYALLAAQKNDGLFDISVIPTPDSSFELPLETEATLPGSYTLRVTDYTASFDEILYLEDRQKGISVELNDSMEYEFTLDGHVQKNVSNPQALLANGPVIASKRSSETSRFYITSQTSVSAEGGGELPEKLSLSQNYPNPFNPSTVISYDIPQQSHVRLAVYDLLGRKIDMLINETQTPGSYKATWDASRFSSGVYFYHLETDRRMLTRRMTLIK